MHLQVERVKLLDVRRNVVDDLHLDFRRLLRLAKFSAQTFSRRITQVSKIVVEILVGQPEPCHWHARHTRETGFSETLES